MTLPRRQVVVVALGAVVAAAAVFGGLAVLGGSGGVEVRLGDDVFRAGQVERLAANVGRDGPIAIPDASPERARDIYLQHLGETPEEGWLAFAAQAPGADRTCLLEWRAGERQFHDPCSDATFPANGSGLTRYATDVTDGELTVDLRASP
ncbi:MAG TPA: hypothetical protein VNT56_00480 [Acidimicrobiales bacterium]|nr:hypothetical protein [Acidimicrobiales bacterium]